MSSSDTPKVIPAEEQRPRRFSLGILSDYGIIFASLTVFVILSILAPAFFSIRNMLNVLDQASQVGLVALGATVTIIGGGFDLSTGAIFAFSGAVAAFIARLGYPGLGLAMGILVGLALGLANGGLISALRVNSFVATLASGLTIRGFAFVLTAGLLIQIEDERFAFLGRGRFLQAKISVYFFAGFALLVWFLLSRTTFGRYVYAIGGNDEAARLSGVRVGLVRTMTFAISGLSGGIAGVIGASHIATGQANVGMGIELSAIAAVVIGGTSIMGGVGAVWRTLLGVLLLQLISNGMNIINVPPFYHLIVQGSVIMFAVAMDSIRHRGR
ncbi:MAG: ABC transporter permease [Anaerolineales bacterium]|nr:MAG: ABC transporter permease [Anaerolineales bacterium]TEU11269.1 MAG: ABC transporter permease [Anaerolineales bacterium]